MYLLLVISIFGGKVTLSSVEVFDTKKECIKYQMKKDNRIKAICIKYMENKNG